MKAQKFLAIAFLCISGLALVFSIVCFTMRTNQMYGISYTPSETYGGDAYTGIQNATANTSNNTFAVGENISDFAGLVKIIGGLSFIIAALTFATIGIYKLMVYRSDNKESADNAQHVVCEETI